MLNVGIDWSSDLQVIQFVDEAGHELERFAIDLTPQGLERLKRRIAAYEPEPGKVYVAIETPISPLVPHLMETGYWVFPVNPKAVDRYRDRFRVSGGASDPYDAAVLAHLIRTDRAKHRRLIPVSETAAELKILSRHLESLMREQTRLVLRLRAALAAYFPQALRLFPKLHKPAALVFLATYPTPNAAIEATPEELERLWRSAHIHNGVTKLVQKAKVVLADDALIAPPVVERAQSRVVADLVIQLQTLYLLIRQQEKALRKLVKNHPAGDALCSLPGLGVRVAARLIGEIGDSPAGFNGVSGLQAYAGMAPITKSSGRRMVVEARTSCNKHLRDACYQWAFASLRLCGWARDYYLDKRRRGATHTEAIRALGNRWLEILWHIWMRRTLYNEALHLTNRSKSALVHP